MGWQLPARFFGKNIFFLSCIKDESMKKYGLHFLLVLFLLHANDLECSMFRTLSRRIPSARQYSSPIKTNVPEESSLRTKVSSWWSNFKGFMSDWLQTSKMRAAKREAEKTEQAKKKQEAERYVSRQATMSQKELADIERKQKEMTKLLEESDKKTLDKMREREKLEKSKAWLEKVRSTQE